MEEKSTLISDEREEIISNIHRNNWLRIPIFSGFFLLSLFLRLSGLNIPWLVIGIIALIFFSNLFYEPYARKISPKRTIAQISRDYLISQIAEVSLLLIIIHFLGALTLGGMAVFMNYAIFCYLGFTRRIYPRILALFTIIGYISLGILEHFKILSTLPPPGLEVNPVENQDLFIASTSFMVGLFICIVIYGDVFSKKLRDTIEILKIKTNQLAERGGELNEAKTTLEIKVEARTKELKDLTGDLEGEVERRTKEIQERMADLERFQRLAVGRELKMMELKKESERLKKELEKKKGQRG